jgi:hypothetical protein
MASGVDKGTAYKKAAVGDLMTYEVERVAEWRLLRLKEEWTSPPKGWRCQRYVDDLGDKYARSEWESILSDAAIRALADKEGREFEEVQMELIRGPGTKEFQNKIVADCPVEGVDYHALLTQHFRAMAGLETIKAIPAPQLQISLDGALAQDAQTV